MFGKRAKTTVDMSITASYEMRAELVTNCLCFAHTVDLQ